MSFWLVSARASGGGQRRHADLSFPGAFEQAEHHVAGALGASLVDHAVE
jgi:hypothetical protein